MCQRGKKLPQNFSYLTKNDIECSLHRFPQISHTSSYPNEYLDWLQGNWIFGQSKILDLTLIFNEILIKVCGCLHSAEIPVKNKHQIVVSKTHSIATLIIHEIHQRNFHIRRKYTLSILAEKYWIPSRRRIDRKLIHDSLYGKRQNAKPDYPIMENLPPDRIKMVNKPFSNVGVAYFGPIIVTLSKLTRLNAIKAWRLGFTC